MKITVLGTGLMGAPMARRLAFAGHDVRVWNGSPARAEALEDVATLYGAPAEAAQDADVVVSMLIDGSVTAEVLRNKGVFERVKPGTLILNMGSVDPATDRNLELAA